MSIIKTLDYGSYNNPISKMMLEHNIQLKKEIINEKINSSFVFNFKSSINKMLRCHTGSTCSRKLNCHST